MLLDAEPGPSRLRRPIRRGGKFERYYNGNFVGKTTEPYWRQEQVLLKEQLLVLNGE